MRHVLFSPPDITEAEISEVVDALKSGCARNVVLVTDVRNTLDGVFVK